MNHFIIMGVQGSGKGTQAKMLADAYDFVHISVGEIFRWNIKAHTRLGTQVRRLVSEGKLVSDAVVNATVEARLKEHDWEFGFILDGYPRSQGQAEFYLSWFEVDALILIEVPDQAVMDRILARRLCSNCARDYNLLTKKPPQPDSCACGGRLIRRADDNEEAIRGRIADYHSQALPVLDAFRAQQKRIILSDGTKGPLEIQVDLRKQLNLPEVQG